MSQFTGMNGKNFFLQLVRDRDVLLPNIGKKEITAIYRYASFQKSQI